MTKSEEFKLEYWIEHLPADQKLSAVKREENGMTILKKDLQSLQKEIKAIEKKIEKLIAAAGKSGKPKAAKKSRVKPVKAKTSKKAPTKKASSKKKPAKLTAADQVLKIINRSKKGVAAATLIKKTGFDAKKIQNIIFRIHKQGKIKRVGKGIYVGA